MHHLSIFPEFVPMTSQLAPLESHFPLKNEIVDKDVRKTITKKEVSMKGSLHTILPYAPPQHPPVEVTICKVQRIPEPINRR